MKSDLMNFGLRMDKHIMACQLTNVAIGLHDLAHTQNGLLYVLHVNQCIMRQRLLPTK